MKDGKDILIEIIQRDRELIPLDGSPLDQAEIDRRFLIQTLEELTKRKDFLKRLRAVNVLRARNDFKTYDNAGLLYFTTAIAGEIGELGEIIEKLAVFAMLSSKSGSLCNLVKKLERARVGGPDHGNTTKLKDITPAKLRDEIGGIQIYLDLMASLLDIEIEEATTEAFNDVSVKIGSDYRL